MAYTIITENDVSQWHDETGIKYHFPNKYLDYLQPGTKVIYYKGRQKTKKFKGHRLTSKPHYFGIATIKAIISDKQSEKKDYYAILRNFTAFEEAVLIREKNGHLIEEIPQNRESNYWRDGVRQIDEDIYLKILRLANIDREDSFFIEGDEDSDPNTWETVVYLEGGKKQVYNTKYERNPRLRRKAIEIHGFDCMGCDINFKERYGSHGKGFIHVHHNKPISTYDAQHKVDPKEDLDVLCPNCHAMVHHKKGILLTVVDLRRMLNDANKARSRKLPIPM